MDSLKEKNIIIETILKYIINFYNKYKKWILSIVAIFISLVILLVLFFVRSRQAEIRIKEKIVYAENLIYQNKNEDAIKLLDEIINSQKITKYSVYAMYIKLNFLYETGNFIQAKDLALKILDIKKPKNLVVPSMYILGLCYQNMGDLDKAIFYFNEIIKNYSEHYLIARVYESLGFCYELKFDIQNAKQVYERMNILYPNSYWSNLAQQKLSYILKKNH